MHHSTEVETCACTILLLTDVLPSQPSGCLLYNACVILMLYIPY